MHINYAYYSAQLLAKNRQYPTSNIHFPPVKNLKTFIGNDESHRKEKDYLSNDRHRIYKEDFC